MAELAPDGGGLLAIMGLIAPAATAETMRERQWYLDAHAGGKHVEGQHR
ncbi:hypothetical protein SANTM175S_06203 [Streptomyces antimycoticus]